jgi:hypothetical protein
MAMTQVVSRQLLTVEVRVRDPVSPYGIYGRKGDTVIGSSQTSSVLRCQYNCSVVLQTNKSSGGCWPQFRDVVSPHHHEHAK